MVYEWKGICYFSDDMQHYRLQVKEAYESDVVEAYPWGTMIAWTDEYTGKQYRVQKRDLDSWAGRNQACEKQAGLIS